MISAELNHQMVFSNVSLDSGDAFSFYWNAKILILLIAFKYTLFLLQEAFWDYDEAEIQQFSKLHEQSHKSSSSSMPFIFSELGKQNNTEGSASG